MKAPFNKQQKIFDFFSKIIKEKIKKDQDNMTETEMKNRRRIGEILKEDFGVPEKDIRKILDTMKNTRNKKFGEIAIELGIVSEETIYKALLIQHDFQFNDMEKLKDVFLKYPKLHEEFIQKKFPDKMYLKDIDALDTYFNVIEIKNSKEYEPYIVLQDKGTGKKYIGLFIPSFLQIEDEINYFDDFVFISSQLYNYYFKIYKKSFSGKNNLEDYDITELLQYLESLGVSDFHIEAQDLTRYYYSARLHGGKSSKVVILEKNIRDVIIEELVHNLKLLMNKDTLEDPPILSGLIKTNLTDVRGRAIERTFRVNIMRASKPPKKMYSIVIRRLKNLDEIKVLGLKGLGYTDKGIEFIKKIIAKNYGINIVAGATNSGKTTLLTTILEELREQNNRILSIENPIEIITNYTQFDLSQYESADEKHKLTQKKAMKGFLRHDPDQVLFQEIRDDEIKDFIELGLRGHTAFATLHAGKVTDVILRLLQGTNDVMSVITALTGIIVQELYPKKCPYCKGKGCHECNKTGKKGVVPVYEIAFFKNINVSRIVNEDGKINFSKYFNFEELIERGEMEYLSKAQVAKELVEKEILFEEDYEKIIRYNS